MRARVKLTESPSGAEIEVGGHRIENGIRALTIEAFAGSIPQIRLELGAAELIDIEGDVRLVMTGAVEKALIALGWTPPAEA